LKVSFFYLNNINNMINDEYVKCNKNQIMKLVAIKIKQDTEEKKNNIDTNVFDLAQVTIKTKRTDTNKGPKKTNIKNENKI